MTTTGHEIGRVASVGTCLALLALAVPARSDPPLWNGYAGDAQHTALSRVASQPLAGVIWQTPVDLDPVLSGGTLYAHYGSALVTAAGTVLVPVKTTSAGAFRVEAHAGANGALRWEIDTDYVLPTSGWVPVFGPALTPVSRLVMPAAGGTLLAADGVDGTSAPATTRVAFYGEPAYDSNPSAFADVKICTPVTSDPAGDVYFGYQATGSNPLGITSGLARVAPDGSGRFVTALAATGGAATQIPINCAPALSRDGQTVYVAMAGTNSYLVALDAATLATREQVELIDPVSGHGASTPSVSSAAPMVGPDDRVYFGVFENPYLNDCGWLLQFDAQLAPAGVPGGFGWDATPSVVPASMVPSYGGGSSYLLMCKYNHYAGAGPGGNGINQLAILDPNDSRFDPNTGATIMKEVLTIAGVTPDSDYIATYPGAVREWCINSAVVDTATHSVLANSEDGRLYRWDTFSNSFTEIVTLTAGLGEAYTPTLVAADGRTYAINDATLFAVGTPTLAVGGSLAGEALAAPWPNPARGETRFAFTLSSASTVRLEVIDLAGRRVATLLSGALPAGQHEARWNGGGVRGAAPAGVYFARLEAGSLALTRRFVRVR